MNKEKQKIINIFDKNIKLNNPKNRKKQETIEQLIIETHQLKGKDHVNTK